MFRVSSLCGVPCYSVNKICLNTWCSAEGLHICRNKDIHSCNINVYIKVLRKDERISSCRNPTVDFLSLSFFSRCNGTACVWPPSERKWWREKYKMMSQKWIILEDRVQINNVWNPLRSTFSLSQRSELDWKFCEKSNEMVLVLAEGWNCRLKLKLGNRKILERTRYLQSLYSFIDSSVSFIKCSSAFYSQESEETKNEWTKSFLSE